MNLDDEDGPPPVTMMQQSSSFTKSFVMEQSVEGGGGGNGGTLRNGKSNNNISYRIVTPEDGLVKITTPDGAVKLNADGRSTLGKPSTETGSGNLEDAVVSRNGEMQPHQMQPQQMPAMSAAAGGGPGGMQYSSQQTTSFSYEYMMDRPQNQ